MIRMASGARTFALNKNSIPFIPGMRLSETMTEIVLFYRS
jgi:hypothetical protein